MAGTERMGLKKRTGIPSRGCGRLLALVLIIMQLLTLQVSAESSADGTSLSAASAVSDGVTTAADTTAVTEQTAGGKEGSIAWSQLEELVKTQNPMYCMYVNSTKTSTDILSSSKQKFDGAMQDQLDEVDEDLDSINEQKKEISDLPGSAVIDEKGTTAEALRNALDVAEKGLKSAKNSIRLGMGQFQGVLKKTENEIEEELQPVREQLTKAAEDLYISYNQLRIRRDSILAQETGYRKILEQQKEAVEKEKLSEESTAELELTVNSLEDGRVEIEAAMEEIRSVLLLQLGEDPAGQLSIGQLPETDMELLAEADPKTDLQAFLKNSKKIEDIKDLENYSGTAAIRIRDLTLEKTEAEAGIRLAGLYYDMRTAAEKLDAAGSGAKAYELEYQKALQLNRLGRLSDINRDIQKIQYEREYAEKKAAAAELFSAVHAYQWALKGQMDF